MSANKRPLAFRLINAVGPCLSQLGVGRIDLTQEALAERACRETGLSDFGDPHYQEALARFLGSLSRDGNMHHVAKMEMRDLDTTRLATRLKSMDLLKRVGVLLTRFFSTETSIRSAPQSRQLRP
mgnify:FL=1